MADAKIIARSGDRYLVDLGGGQACVIDRARRTTSTVGEMVPLLQRGGWHEIEHDESLLEQARRWRAEGIG